MISGRWPTAERLVWVALSVVLLVAPWVSPDRMDARFIAICSVVSGLFCARVFLGHGGRAITPLGIWAVVCGFTGCYAGLVGASDPRVSSWGLSLAIVLVHIQTLGIALLAWTHWEELPLATWTEGRSASVMLIVLVYICDLGLSIGPVPSLFTEGIGFACVLFFACAVWSAPGAHLWSWGTMGIVVFLLLYIAVLHTGQGRLRIVALALGVMVVASLRFPSRGYKWASFAAIPFVLAFLSWYRLAHIREISGSTTGRTGLESLTDPLIAFARIIDVIKDHTFQFQGYRNLLSPLHSVLPKSWGIPEAFGYELVRVWNTERFGTGYSAAATSAGEWYWMGGVIGIVLSIVVIGLYLRLLAFILMRCAPKFMVVLGGAVGLVIALLLISSLGDLGWMGTHVYWYRSVIRIGTAIFLLVIVAMFRAVVVRNRKPSLRGASVRV